MPPLSPSIRESGKLKLLGRADTGGKNGVRQALDPSGKFLIVANYASGTVAVLPVARGRRAAQPDPAGGAQGHARPASRAPGQLAPA